MKVKLKILALILVSALLTGMLPSGGMPVKAAGKSSHTLTDSGKYGLKNPTTDCHGITTWDCIYFGNYPQKSAKQEKKEKIKWRVLSVEGDDAFLLADQNIECRAYNDTDVFITWETCALRSWLNGYGVTSSVSGRDYTEDNFLKNAFSESEQMAIKTTTVINKNNTGTDDNDTEENDTMDKIYLLSACEAGNPKYGFTKEESETTTREARTTTYARKRGAIMSMRQDYDGNSSWWLRSSSRNFSGTDVDIISTSGCISSGGENADNAHITVRPVLHLNLSFESVWLYAGTVNSAATVKVKKLKAEAKEGTLKIRWQRVSRPDGYELWYSTSKNWKKKKIRTTTERTLTLRKLKRKNIYYIRVCSYRIRSGKKVYSRWSSTCRKKV